MVGYNAEIYLPTALEYLLKQSFRDFEFVFIDNGSTDSTAFLIKKFQEEHPEIDMKLGRIEINNGLPAGRNLGLSMAKGKYVLFHDVDDWMDLDCLEVLSCAARINGSERIIQQIRYVNDKGEELEQLTYTNDASRWSKYMLQGDLFLRKIIVNNGLSFAQNVFYDDFYFVCLFNSVSKKAHFINETHYNMRMHEHSLTHEVGARIGYYPSCLELTFQELTGICEKLTDEQEKALYEYSCIQMYYYLVFHSIDMSILQKVEEYKILNKIMVTYYPDYLNNRNVKLFSHNGFKGHFKRNIWICNKAERVDKVMRFPLVMSLILSLYHLALEFGLYKYKA